MLLCEDGDAEIGRALKWFTWKRYQWASATLDSRSIWWSGGRHLVPLLDLINCEDGGRRVHSTVLDEVKSKLLIIKLK